MRKGFLVPLALTAALLGGVVAAGIIVAQTGPEGPEPAATVVGGPFTPPPLPDCTADPAAVGCPLPPITPEPPYVAPPLPSPAVPLAYGLREDCPAGWDSVGQPGAFSICYPPDGWEQSGGIFTQPDERWMASAVLRGPPRPIAVGDRITTVGSIRIGIGFSPTGGYPLDSLECTNPGVPDEHFPVQPVQVGPFQGFTCIYQGLWPSRLYTARENISGGEIRVRFEGPEPVPADVLETAFRIAATLQVQK